jgi:DNA-binding SARP family transcriptional activator/WD40 repeat protein
MGIDLLGPAHVGGTDGADVPLGHRDRVILAALALEPGAVLSPDRLADALWGEAPPKSWPKVVQGSMMRLRRTLGPDAIETTGGGYRLTLTDDDVDTLRFERLVARGRAFAAVHEPARAVTAFERALALWRGPPFPELDAWDEGRAAAARLTEVHRAAEEELVEARLATGRPAEAAAEARVLVAREPFREHRWALLAVALYRSGRQREALDVLRRAATTLRHELGLDPGSELVALEQAVLRQDPTLLAVPDGRVGTGLTCPYKGLRPYHAEDAEAFFGREQAIVACLARLADSPLLVIVGPSGSGKSSLVGAGVVPALRAEGHRVVELNPGTQPIAAWTAALASAPQPVVAVVDQLEELFTAPGADADVEPFLARLIAQAETGTPIVVTLRADYMAGLAASPRFARLAERGLVLLTPMTEAELRQAIEAPATQDGLLLEPGLVDLLLRDVLGEPGGLPLLSHALAETWERREGNVLTVEGYLQTGGIRAAVAQSAERLYDSLPPADRAGLRTVLLRLVTPTPSGDPVGARVPTRVFAGAGDAPRLLDLLVRSRLVTADAETAIIAHESLARAWPRLRSWLDEDIEGQRIFQHLQVAADGWNALGRPEEELYRGGRLQSAIEWRERATPVLAASEADFLVASREREHDERRRQDVELRRQRRRNRQLRVALVGVVGLLALALVAGTLAAVNSHHAHTAATDADAARLGAAALVEPRIDVALLLARQAVALADTPTTEGSLLETLGRQRGLESVVRPTPGPFFPVPGGDWLSADGTRELMDGADGVDLVDTHTGRAVGTAPLGPQPDLVSDPQYPAGFVDGGRTALVSRAAADGSAAREVVAFSAGTGRPLGPPQPVPESVSGDYFRMDRLRASPDGGALLSVLDRTVRIWRRGPDGWGKPAVFPLPTLPASVPEQDLVWTVTFSADGTRAALMMQLQGPSSGFLPRVGIVVAIDTPRLLLPLVTPEPGGRDPSAIAISPDGRQLAVGDRAGWVELRGLPDRTGPTVRIPGASPVNALGWALDGTRLVVGHLDGTMAVFATNPLQAVAQYSGLGSGVVLVALRGGGDLLIGQDFAGGLTQRSITGTNAFMRVIATKRANAIAAGPAGSVVALGEDDGKISLYDQSTLARKPGDLSLGPFAEPDNTFAPAIHRRVSALAITPDGSALIGANRVGHLRMWSLPERRLLWSRDDVPVSFLAVSPDGRYLATSGFTADPSDTLPDTPQPVSTRFTVWDLSTKQVVLTDDLPHLTNDDPGHTPKPRAVAFSPDSMLVAAGFFQQPVVVYDLARRARRLTLPTEASSLVFNPAGNELLVRNFTSDGHVTGYDPQTGRPVETFPTPSDGYSHLTFTTDGKWLIGSDPTTLDIWDARTRRLVVSELPLPANGTNDALSLAATADHRLFVATQTSLVAIDMNLAHWDSLACAMAGRALTQAEWNRFLPQRSYAPACA